MAPKNLFFRRLHGKLFSLFSSTALCRKLSSFGENGCPACVRVTFQCPAGTKDTAGTCVILCTCSLCSCPAAGDNGLETDEGFSACGLFKLFGPLQKNPSHEMKMEKDKRRSPSLCYQHMEEATKLLPTRCLKDEQPPKHLL